MYEQRVVLLNENHKVRDITDLSSFQVNAKHKYAKLVYRLVGKMKKWGMINHKVDHVKESSYEQVTFNYEDIAREFFENINRVRYNGDEVSMIIVGRDVLPYIIRETGSKLNSPFSVQIGADGPRYGIAGIRIIFNPSMLGVVFVPKSCLK